MRVLIGILKYPPDFTGAGLQTHRTYRNLLAGGKLNCVNVITSVIEAPTGLRTLDGILINGVTRNRYPDKQQNIAKVALKILAVLRAVPKIILAFTRVRKQIDVVHTIDSSWLSTIVAWCAILAGKPLMKEICLIGHDDPIALLRKHWSIRWLFLFPFHRARLIVTQSRALSQSVVRYGIPTTRTWCRYNPIYIDVDNTKLSEQQHGLDAVIDDPGMVILWVGTITRRKNIEFLLKATQYLEGNVCAIFVGPKSDKAYFDEMQSIFLSAIDRQAKGNVRIIFIDRIHNPTLLARLYRKANLFWFASHAEGLPNVVGEALWCGTPVVTLPVQGIMTDLIESPEDGEIVETEDPKVFAATVNRWLRRPFDRQAIAARAQVRFDPAQIEGKYLERLRMLGCKP